MHILFPGIVLLLLAALLFGGEDSRRMVGKIAKWTGICVAGVAVLVVGLISLENALHNSEKQAAMTEQPALGGHASAADCYIKSLKIQHRPPGCPND